MLLQYIDYFGKHAYCFLIDWFRKYQ